jgi:glucose-6-phosphate 1-epimerase
VDPLAAPALIEAITPDGDRLALSLDGGQLLSWVCAGRERLFVSPNAVGGPGRSVRGGVPVIFPQFGLFGPGAKHGFARMQRWRPADPGVPGAVAAELEDSGATRSVWPHAFRLRVVAQAAGPALTMTLTVTNPGPTAFDFAAALHTYLAVDDLAACTLHGLEGRPFLDCAGGGRVPRVHGPEPLAFDGEVDRVYSGIDELLMSAPGDALRIGARAFTDTVVWNPGAELAAGLADLGVGQHARFACVESAVVADPVRLDPGAVWQGVQHLVITGQHPSFPS